MVRLAPKSPSLRDLPKKGGSTNNTLLSVLLTVHNSLTNAKIISAKVCHEKGLTLNSTIPHNLSSMGLFKPGSFGWKIDPKQVYREPDLYRYPDIGWGVVRIVVNPY